MIISQCLTSLARCPWQPFAFPARPNTKGAQGRSLYFGEMKA
uniref:Uncharacterized protein n=1 Tax=Anguilla anguilla TaxID=7936 RepID=A0A0E9THN6_ANGAN